MFSCDFVILNTSLHFYIDFFLNETSGCIVDDQQKSLSDNLTIVHRSLT